MKSYIVKYLDSNTDFSGDVWELVPNIEIDLFPWDLNGYRPKSEIKIFYTDRYFCLRFSSEEKKIRATYLNMNDDVFEDSCMEIFLIPYLSEDNKYMNFEFNAFGSLLLGIGNNRDNRVRLKVDPSIFEIKALLNKENIDRFNEDSWTVECKIPFDFLEEYYGKIDFHKGHKMKANFYKCGDKTEYPHYGCWNKIENEIPNFHLSQFFGELILG